MLTKLKSIQRHKKLAPHPWQYRIRNIGLFLSSIFIYYQTFWFDYEKMGQLPENHILPKVNLLTYSYFAFLN